MSSVPAGNVTVAVVLVGASFTPVTVTVMMRVVTRLLVVPSAYMKSPLPVRASVSSNVVSLVPSKSPGRVPVLPLSL